MLAADGVMSLNCFGTIPEARVKFWIDFLEESGLDASALREQLDSLYKKRDAGRSVLLKYFKTVNAVNVPCQLTYETVEELFIDLEKCVPEQRRYLDKNQEKIKRMLELKLASGVVKVPHDATFWRLSL